MNPPLHIAAAIIRKDGRILIGRRGPGGNCAWLWEFPGGKLEPGETVEQCAVRECREELDVDICVTGEFGRSRYPYPDREVHITFLNAQWRKGTPVPIVHRDLRWVLPRELPDFPFCPADREIVKRLVQDGTEKRS